MYVFTYCQIGIKSHALLEMSATRMGYMIYHASRNRIVAELASLLMLLLLLCVCLDVISLILFTCTCYSGNCKHYRCYNKKMPPMKVAFYVSLVLFPYPSP